MYDVHLGRIGKRVVDFLLVLIELFSLNRTAEALRAIIMVAHSGQPFPNSVHTTLFFKIIF